MPAQVFAIPVLDKWLLHAPLHQITGLVNQAVVEQLRDGRAADQANGLAELWEALSAPPIETPGPLSGAMQPSFLGIIPTRGCNIGCVYCNFGGPTAEMTHMDPRIAVAAIDWMADKLVRNGQKELAIHFFGGEPFVSPEIVDLVVHRTRYVAAQRGLTPCFHASTNGVFNESRARFVGDYFFSVVLSFDGFQEFHDRNRPGYRNQSTFEVVARTARRLSEMPLDLCLRVCITHESVGQMEEITRWMCQEFKPAIINFETLTPGELGAAAGLHPPDPYEFAARCIRSYRVAEGLGVKAVYSAAETDRNRISFCPVGSDSPIVALDGRASACYLLPEDWAARGLNMDFARIGADGSVELDFDALERIRKLPLDKPRCEGCYCQWSCAGGCHVNHSWPGCRSDYDDFCIQTRIITACLLLEEAGCRELADQLLASRPAMEALALQPWDAIIVGSNNHSLTGPPDTTERTISSADIAKESTIQTTAKQEMAALSLAEWVASPLTGEPDGTPATYRCAANMCWAVERRGIMLLAEGRGAVCTLIYPAAAIWDLMTRSCRHEQIVNLVSHVAGLELDAAERYVARVLEEWTAAGFLTKEATEEPAGSSILETANA